MSSIIGNSIKYMVFGESHTRYLGMSIDGIKAGLKIDFEQINIELEKRRPSIKYQTKRVESDSIEWISGVNSGITNGLPITFLIKNTDIKSSDYNESIPRPSHADYGAYIKYNSYNTKVGGGVFSGRLTVLYVVAGSIVSQLLYTRLPKLEIQTNLVSLGQLDIGKNTTAETINEYLEKIANEKDSVGGRIKLTCTGIPAGIGEPLFDSFESIISHYMFSIPGLKAIEFGKGVEISRLKGSDAADEMSFLDENNPKKDEVIFHSNNNGGIVGGITNSAPIEITLSFKPTPSIPKKLRSVDFTSMKNTIIQTKGRHDIAYVTRVEIVVQSVFKMSLYDLINRNRI